MHCRLVTPKMRIPTALPLLAALLLPSPVLGSGIKDAPRPTLLDFWAENCGACRPALKELQALHLQHPRLRILGIDMDDAANLSEAKALAQRYGLTYPVRFFPAANLRLARAYGVQVYPTLILLDGRGHAVWSHGGLLDARAQAALEARAATLPSTHPEDRLLPSC